ncbi:MAG: PorT family protein [Cyclobacteriaceae bacterium]|nr:PorT family protein [Cyclobacteriaceae bacterium]
MSIKFLQTSKVAFVFIILYIVNDNCASSQLLIGAKAGAQVGWVSFDNKENNDFFKLTPVPGYNVGFVSSFRVKKRFFLQTELNYSRKGKMIEGKLDQLLENRVTNHFLNVPITYKVHFKGSAGDREFKWNVGFGPDLGYWLKSKGTLVSSELEENDIEKLLYQVNFKYDPNLHNTNEMYIENVNRFQLGLNFSTGMVFEPIGGAIIMLDLRYEMGGTLFAKSDYGQFPGLYDYKPPMKIKNNILQLSLAYLIDTKISESKKGKRMKLKEK